MKSNAISLIVVIIVTVGVCFFISPWLSDQWMIHRGNQIVSRIDAYHASHGQLPDRLDRIGIGGNEEGPFYYERRDGSYILWYGKALGESMIYRGATHNWEDD